MEYNIQKTLSEDHEGYIDPSAPSIDHVFLSNILTFLQSHNPSCAKNYSFHEVLKSTSLYIEPPPPRKPDPEYVARMDMLRKRLEQQKYDNMVRNIRPAPNTMSLFSPDEEGYSAADAKMTKNQVSAIINILLSMISVFVAIFIWMKNSPDYLRVLWSFFFALVVGASEAGLYCLHWWNVEKSQSKEEIRKREKRAARKEVTRDKKVQ